MSQFDFAALVAPPIKPLTAYDPGYEPTEVKRALNLAALAELGSNESAYGPSPDVLTYLRNLPLEVTHRYPDAGGRVLKRALAAHYQLTPEHFTLGNGSHELLVLMAQTFASAQDAVVFSQYGFAVYALAAQASGARSVKVPATQQLAADPLAMVQAARRERAKIVYLANPNNPTGNYWDHSTLLAFMRELPSDTLMVLDEAYHEYADPALVPDGSRLLGEFPNLIVARTFSKAYGMAGLRVGYVMADPGLGLVLERTRLSFNVNQFALRAAAIALGDQSHISKAREANARARAALTEALETLPIRVLPSQGNFLLCDFARDAAPIEQALLKRGVLVRPMRGYGLPHMLRITIGQPWEQDMLVEALRALLA